jgi:soluble lytic murein transglycosylase-like protein
MMSIIVITFILLLSYNSDANSSKEIIKQIQATSKVAGIDPDLTLAIATVESGLNPNAIGGLNEIGLFQLRPEYHNVTIGDFKQNILVGVSYLSYVKSKCWNKYKDAWFVGFNYGPKCKLVYPKRTAYYKKVMREINKIKVKKYLSLNFKHKEVVYDISRID